MSKVGVLVAVIVAVVLCGAAALLLRGGGPGGSGGGGKPEGVSAGDGRLLDFDPARLVEIRFERARKVETARRSPGGEWTIGLGPDNAWPAQPERVRAAMRVFANLRAQREAEKGTRIEGEAARVVLKMEGGAERVMRIATRSLAGSALVEVGEGATARAAWVDASVSDMVAGTGLSAWRREQVFAGIGEEVSRITISGVGAGTGGAKPIALARLQGRWVLREPVSEAAEPEMVARLASRLSSVRVADFLDGGAPDRTGLESPVATLVTETDERDAADASKVRTLSMRLEVGGVADVGGKNVFARITHEASGVGGGSQSRVVVVTGEPLAEISTDPAMYVSRKAVQAPAADVGVVRVRRGGEVVAEFRRTLDGWRKGASAESPLTEAELTVLGKTLALLTAGNAEGVRVMDALPEGVAEIELLSLGGAPIASVRVMAPAEGLAGGGIGTAGAKGAVVRGYPAAAMEPVMGLLR